MCAQKTPGIPRTRQPNRACLLCTGCTRRAPVRGRPTATWRPSAAEVKARGCSSNSRRHIPGWAVDQRERRSSDVQHPESHSIPGRNGPGGRWADMACPRTDARTAPKQLAHGARGTVLRPFLRPHRRPSGARGSNRLPSPLCRAIGIHDLHGVRLVGHRRVGLGLPECEPLPDWLRAALDDPVYRPGAIP